MSDNRIKTNPTEPRFHLRAVAQDGKELQNREDVQLVMELNGEFYDVCPNYIRMNVGLSNVVTATIQIDLHGVVIDVPSAAIRHIKEDVHEETTIAQVRIVGERSPMDENPINSNFDLSVTSQECPVYAKYIIFEADGRAEDNHLIVYDVVHDDESEFMGVRPLLEGVEVK